MRTFRMEAPEKRWADQRRIKIFPPGAYNPECFPTVVISRNVEFPSCAPVLLFLFSLRRHNIGLSRKHKTKTPEKKIKKSTGALAENPPPRPEEIGFLAPLNGRISPTKRPFNRRTPRFIKAAPKLRSGPSASKNRSRGGRYRQSQAHSQARTPGVPALRSGVSFKW